MFKRQVTLLRTIYCTALHCLPDLIPSSVVRLTSSLPAWLIERCLCLINQLADTSTPFLDSGRHKLRREVDSPVRHKSLHCTEPICVSTFGDKKRCLMSMGYNSSASVKMLVSGKKCQNYGTRVSGKRYVFLALINLK